MDACRVPQVSPVLRDLGGAIPNVHPSQTGLHWVLYSRPMTEGLHRFYGGNDLHFLTFSCYRRQPLFSDASCCDLFLQILERVRRRYRLVVLAYVVMPEHVHLLVNEPQRETVSTAIQALKLGFVRSLRQARGESLVAAPMSRNRGETWGTPGRPSLRTSKSINPNRFWQVHGPTLFRKERESRAGQPVYQMRQGGPAPPTLVFET